RRNPLTGPRFLSIVCYAMILEYALTLPAIKLGGAMSAFVVASLCVTFSGVILLVIGYMNWTDRLRSFMSIPALSALAFIVATTTISGQISGLNQCSESVALPALAVASTVILVAFGIKYRLQPGTMLYRSRLFISMVIGSLVYFVWRNYAPTPALCSTVSQIHGGEITNAILGFWRWKELAFLSDPQVILTLFSGSAILALLCLIDTLSAASSLASDEGQPDAMVRNELLANAWGNTVFGTLGLLPISISLSRSRTISELKPADSKIPAISHSVFLLLLIFCLIGLQWPLLDYLPKAVIAGTLVVVSIEMLDEKSVLLWRAALGASKARKPLATGLWIFLLAVSIAVLMAIGPWSKLAITVAFLTAVVASLLGLVLAPKQEASNNGVFSGRLHFLNIGSHVRRWKAGDHRSIDLSMTQAIDFTAACAIRDIARAQAGKTQIAIGENTGKEVSEILEVLCPESLKPYRTE
ncbi:hypothetical protein, partial [Undibacterium luofuense]|uniref:hypothetical protein n=1 Tax=Undibacterium luofuense TaxID=2828733 RepID=UPI0030EE85B2